jgi:hypothetical protein
MRKFESGGHQILNYGLENFVQLQNAKESSENVKIHHIVQTPMKPNDGSLLHNWDVFGKTPVFKWRNRTVKLGVKSIRAVKIWKSRETRGTRRNSYIQVRHIISENLCPILCRVCLFDPSKFCDRVIFTTVKTDLNDYFPLKSRVKSRN